MSQTIRDILHAYEVSPPAGNWDRIAQELDEWTVLSGTGRSLGELEIDPPAAAWTAIREQLEEADLSRQLLALETDPPARVWSAVEQSLNPAAKQLSIRPWLRYAAAAVLTGLLVWTGWRLLPETDPRPGTAGVPAPATTTANKELNEKQARENLATIIESTQPPVNASEEVRSEKALEASKKTLARVEPGLIKRKLQHAAAFSFERPVPAEEAAPRYVVLLTPDGNMIRMSKKLKDMLCCLTGEDSDPACQEQVRKWQDKLINAPGSHAPGNFADLLDMLNALNENR
jgi:hypothetical protein